MSPKIQTFSFHTDLLRAILWQYEDTENLKQLAKYKSEYFEKNTTEFWSQWYRDVFNIDTANDFGLTVWARILNISIGIDISSSDISKVGFGFGRHRGNFRTNFKRNVDYSLVLSTEQKRLIIRMRYFNLTQIPTVPNINQFLKTFFWNEENRVFVLDTLDMSYIYYVFNFTPSESLRLLLDHTDLMPRPSGVGVKYRIVTKNSFGHGQHRKNFLSSNFGA